jgi:WD40 repeat protein
MISALASRSHVSCPFAPHPHASSALGSRAPPLRQAVAKSDFFITASMDGHVKFWKKMPEGIEFVKHFWAHTAPVDGMAVSHDGSLLATVSRDGTAKVFDILTFDMVLMLKLDFVPSVCEWMYRVNEAKVRTQSGGAFARSTLHTWWQALVGSVCVRAAKPCLGCLEKVANRK